MDGMESKALEDILIPSIPGHHYGELFSSVCSEVLPSMPALPPLDTSFP